MTNKIEYYDWHQSELIENPNMNKLKANTQQYGNKLTTPNALNIDGKVYPIWAICWSNSASMYIIKNGKRLFLHDYPIKD